MEREWDRERECVYKSVCKSYYLRLLSILWRNQMGSIHTTLSSGGSLQPLLVIFCHQSSAIFSLLLLLPSPLSPPPSFSFFFFLPLCLHLGPPMCTVDFCSFNSAETFVECLTYSQNLKGAKVLRSCGLFFFFFWGGVDNRSFLASCELHIVAGTVISCVYI